MRIVVQFFSVNYDGRTAITVPMLNKGLTVEATTATVNGGLSSDLYLFDHYL